MNKRFIFFILILIFTLGIGVYDYSRFYDGKLHLIFCNVGQGDAIFIRTPKGDDILIDGGPDDSVLNCLSNHMPFWDKDIEVMVLTHPHADHLTGLIYVLERYEVMHYFTEKVESSSKIYKRLQDSLAAKNITANYTFSGDRIDFADKTTFLTIWPNKEYVINQELQDSANSEKDSSSLDLNGFSVISKLSFGNFHALLTGDAGVKTEESIGKFVGKVDVLKVPHHGSKTGMSDLFLSEISPKLAVISVAAKNRYGHPSSEMLTLLKKHLIKTLRTDIDGEIEVVSNGTGFEVY
jgi:competence protein ComEC